MSRRFAARLAGIAPTLAALLLSGAPSHAQSNNGNRTLTFVNHCSQTVRLGINGGFVQNCGSNGSCPTGTTCLGNPPRNPPGCFWSFPSPTSGTQVLAPGGKPGHQVVYNLTNPPLTSTITNGPAKGQTVTVKWSGNVYGMTGCDAQGNNCTTGLCPNPQGGPTVVPCQSGQGPGGPATLAEFTLVPTGADVYDISLINGFNVPISMAPTSRSTNPSGKNPYWCRTPGATVAAGGLSACPWTFKTKLSVNGGNPTDYASSLRWVSPGGAACGANGSCALGVCGLSGEPGRGTTITQLCGTQKGWWNAFEVCTFNGGADNSSFGAPFNCSQQITGQGQMSELYLCVATNAQSCYTPGAAAQCCGCPTWKVGGKTLPVSPGISCASVNPAWTANSQPWSLLVKQACPTAYSFPFDDATSTFTCQTANPSTTNPNNMGYTITFCPGDKTGL
jgi:hypothetical protein